MAAGYNITVSVVDNATKQINAINKQLAAAQAPFNRLSKSLSKFADLSGITKFNAGLKGLVGYAERIISSMGRLLPALGILAGATSIAGIYKLAEAFGNLGTKLDNDAVKIGTTATKLQLMQNAARLAGGSAGDMTSSIEGLGQAMQDALSGKNMDAAALFANYGLDIRSAGYQAKSGAEKMGDAFEIIKRMNDAGASAATQRNAMSIMGLSPNLLRQAQQGRAGLEAYNKEAAKFGYMTPEQIKRAEDLQHAITEVQLATEGLANSIFADLSPVLVPLLEQFANWVAKNREWIATKIAEYVKQFSDWISTINWEKVHEDFNKFIKDTNDIIDGLGGFKTASEALIAVWIGSAALSMLANLAAMAAVLTNPVVLAAVATIAAALATFKNGQDAASSQDLAGNDGYTEVAGVDGDGMPTSFRNPTTGDVKSSMNWDPRYAGVRAKAGQGWGDDHPTTPETAAKAKDAMDYFISKGMDPMKAAGFVASAQMESGFNTGARGDNGTAGGVMQWHKDRRDAILKGTGIDVWAEKDPHKQYDAVMWELENNEKAANEKINKSKTSSEYGDSVSRYYERPAATEMDAARRAALAKNIYHTNITNKPASSTPAPDTQAPQPTAGTGKVDITLTHVNPPPNTNIKAYSTGEFVNPLTIVRPMSPWAAF